MTTLGHSTPSVNQRQDKPSSIDTLSRWCVKPSTKRHTRTTSGGYKWMFTSTSLRASLFVGLNCLMPKLWKSQRWFFSSTSSAIKTEELGSRKWSLTTIILSFLPAQSTKCWKSRFDFIHFLFSNFVFLGVEKEQISNIFQYPLNLLQSFFVLSILKCLT